MNRKRAQGRIPKAQSKAVIRPSISLPSAIYETQGKIAQKRTASLPRLPGDAVEKRLADKWSLLTKERSS
jgi:hypothetical protein